ncbi:MAG: aminotransferase class V-fold PLP-dependent enzyme [Candidatus Kariarchaeaceae archaeon]
MSLDPGLIYLNHASVGPWPKTTYRIVKDRYEGMAHRGELGFDVNECLDELDLLFLKFSKLINCEPEGVGFTGSTSDGMHHFATGLEFNDLQGKNIILNDLEFTANSIVWQQMAAKYKMEIRTVKSVAGRLHITDFERVIDNQTAFVAISSVQFSNGFRIDLEALSDLIHNHGGYLVVDAIQHVGALQFDVKRMEVDFLTVGGYKWLLAPYGTGLVYIKPELQERLKPISITWHGQADFTKMTHHNYEPAEFGKQYTTVGAIHPAMFGLSASLDYHLKWNPATSEQYLYSLTDYIVESFRNEIPEFILNSPRNSKLESSQILSFKSSINAEDLLGYLKENGIVCSVREGNLRIAPHVYTTKEDIDILVETIQSSLGAASKSS